MVKESGAINYRYYYSAVNSIIDISKLVQLLVKDDIFE